MSIEKVNKNFEKGLAILVGEITWFKNVYIDGISLHVAYCLGNRIELLDIAHILPEDENIYLIGHGSLKKFTIDGRNMNDVAELLIKANYCGKQNIYVTSCDAALIKDEKSIAVELKRCLEEKLQNKKEKSNDLNIESDARGKSVYIENNDNIEMWIITPDVNTTCSYLNQSNYIHKNGYGFKFRPSHYQRLITNINEFKVGLLASKRKGQEFMEVDGREYWGALTTLFAPIIPLFIAFIVMICGYKGVAITRDLMCNIIIIESILGIVLYVIQKNIRIDSWGLLLAYKSCWLAVFEQILSFILIKGNISSLTEMLMMTSLGILFLWIILWLFLWVRDKL